MRVTWPRWIAASSTLVAILAMLSSAAHARDGAGRPRTDPRRAERAGQGPSVLHGSGADGGTVFDGESFWWIGGISGSDTGATSAVPNAGVLTQLDVVPYPPDGGCFDCWTSDLLANGYWGQVGFSSCNFGESTMYDLTAFYQVWDTNSNPAAILVDGETTVVTPGLHTYAMVNTSGTTWEYLVDGSPLGRYDMGAGSATSYAAVATVCEEGDGITAPFVPPAISVPVAMSVVDPSTSDWSGATAGWLYNTSGLSGVAGDIADPQLAEDAMIIGGSGPHPDAGLTLWSGASSGAPVDGGVAANAPPLVLLTLPVPNATVEGTVPLTATVQPALDAGGPLSLTFVVQDYAGLYSNEWTVASPPYVTSWDTTQAPNEAIVVTAIATDSAGDMTWMDVTVTVDNPATTATSSASSASASSSSSSSSSASSSSSSGTSTTRSATATASTSSTGTLGAAGTTSSGGATVGSTGGSGATSTASTASSSSGTTATHTPPGATASSTGGGSGASSGCGCSSSAGSGALLELWLSLLLLSATRRRGSRAYPFTLSEHLARRGAQSKRI